MVSDKKPKKGAKDMMNNEEVKKAGQFKIDLTQIEGDGTFQCPRCKTTISPDDETENVYTILDTKVVNNELVELVISCGTCDTILRLTGFQQSIEL